MAKVTIDGKEYDTDALSEQARNNLLNVQYCDRQAAELERRLAITRTARNAYAQALKGALPTDA